MVDAVADLLDAGRVKLYCVDSYDAGSWSNRSLPLEERARRHGAYESWILDQVVPLSTATAAGRSACSPPASAWARSTLRTSPCGAPTTPVRPCACRATTTRALRHGWGEQGEALYFQNPTAYVANLHGDHLRARAATSTSRSSAGRACGRTPPGR